MQGWSLWLQALMFISRFAARKAGEGKGMECPIPEPEAVTVFPTVPFNYFFDFVGGGLRVEGNDVFWLVGTTVFHAASSH